MMTEMIPISHLSPVHKLNDFYPWDRPLTDQQMIEIFLARIEGYQLAPAETLLSPAIHHAGFAALHILMSYFEGIEQYKQGKRSNSAPSGFFWRAFQEVFRDEIEELKGKELGKSFGNDLYHNLRCGLYHDGSTRQNIRIHGDYPSAFSVNDYGLVEINPHLFPNKIRRHLYEYVNELRRPDYDQLQKFKAMFELAFQGKLPDGLLKKETGL
ncbi:MAG: hypothetical protein IAE80_09990 [Anaerolinea sp.]|nr:hypothetical protein [Anaerolinea sp.]